jgi:FMN phosphatase YigB (HAD superfamily)
MNIIHSKPVIVLDAGRVLVDFDFNKVFIELSERHGVTTDGKQIDDLDSIFYPLQVGKQEWGTIPQVLNRTFGASLDSEQWRNLCCSIFVGEVPGMRDVLADLSSDFKLIAFSNTIEVHWECVLQKYPIFQLLDGWVVSYQEELIKPDAAIYRAVSDRYCNGRPPFYFTDDTLENVEAAKNLGWDAEVFRDAATFAAQIEKRRFAL